MSDSEPLLDNEEEWNKLEEGEARLQAITVQQLIAQDPDNVLQWIRERGVIKIGEFRVQDTVLFSALNGRPMLTLGSDNRDINAEAVWRQKLQRATGRHSGTKQAGWSKMVVAEAFVVNISRAAAPDREGLLQPLLKRWQAGAAHYSVFGLPAVQAVIEHKWQTFAGTMLMYELVVYLLWLVSFMVFSLAWQDEDPSLSLPALLATTRGRVIVSAELLSLAAMTPFLWIEASTLRAYDWRGWLNIWNALDLATYVLQISIAVLHLGRLALHSGWLSVIVAVQCVLLFFRLNFFMRVFRATSFSFLDSMKQVLKDVGSYLGFLVLMMFGFACAFCVLFRQDQGYEQFSDVGHALLTMFSYAFGGVDLTIMLNSRNPRSALALSLLYQFAMSMILMNLLIGVICNSVDKATEHQDLKLLLSKTQVVDELEATIPPFVERLLPGHYPAYVHVLRVDPKSMDSIPDENQLWHCKPGDGPCAAHGASSSTSAALGRARLDGRGATAGDGDMAALMAEISALRAQVSQLNDMLQMAVPSLPSSPDRGGLLGRDGE